MAATNTVSMVGNLCADPKLSITKNHTYKATARVAVSNSYLHNGEWQTRTAFVNIVTWGNLAHNFAQSAQKGTRIMFTGSLDVRSYVPDGGVPGIDYSYFSEINVSELGLSLKWASGHTTPNNVSPDNPAIRSDDPIFAPTYESDYTSSEYLEEL